MIDIFTQYLKDEGKSKNLVCPTSSGILEMANTSKDVKKGRSKYNPSYQYIETHIFPPSTSSKQYLALFTNKESPFFENKNHKN